MKKSAREWLEDADRRFLEAVQRVASATTQSQFPRTLSPECEWEELERELAHLARAARERHVAKHCAMREAMLAPPQAVIVVRTDDDADLSYAAGRARRYAEVGGTLCGECGAPAPRPAPVDFSPTMPCGHAWSALVWRPR